MTGTVEILMAAFNGEAYLREQLDSILAQTDGDWHLTASDDGSADGTAGILREYAEKDPGRIRVYESGKQRTGRRGTTARGRRCSSSATSR